MVIADRLYTQINIDNPIIEELINTKPFQRLKAINQYGGVNLVFKDKYQVTRFQHSLGVYHVLKTFGADLELQIAGLLHDVGHTAMSHMYDMALSTHAEDNHEKIMEGLEGWDEIQNILNKNSLKIGNPDEYMLLKKPLPDIGADRFDYALRDYMFATKEYTGTAELLLKSLSFDSEGFFFNTVKDAKLFAELGNKAMWLVIYDPVIAVVYQSIIEMIRLGFKDHWLTNQDFLQTDKYVFDKMMNAKDKVPEKYIKIFTNNYAVIESTVAESDFTFVKLKSRYFDPMVRFEGTKKRVSDLDSDFRKSLADYVEFFEKAKQGIYYKVDFTE